MYMTLVQARVVRSHKNREILIREIYAVPGSSPGSRGFIAFLCPEIVF